ncbi:hypothetical protein C2R22_05965 [Salinigranum rubrum]|uniref:Uncharacterized protein n=1 Tax=Salinigranum rubrum TaxID=755307 RepID=A0A2I8VH97_9EURY|nr:hypothetical protein C2R22_05965 [Salinigranum rubrum]
MPIPEGETTTGLSNEPTYWGRDVLKNAVESGAFDGAKLLKSPGGVGHKEMEALADPDNIVGSVEGARYEEGVGPVLDGDLLDEHLSTLVDKGLVGVSPDLYRTLGEFDDDLEAAPAEEILDVPYITILDRGASDGATIEPASAEALAASPAGRFLQATGSDADQLASSHTLRFDAYGEMFGDEFLDAAVSNLNAIDGVSAMRSKTNTDPTLLAMVSPDAVDTLDTLNERIITALEDTPFEVYEDFDWLDRVSDRLAAGDDDEQASDEGAESSTGSTDTTPSMGDEPTKEELREQLAEVKAELNEKDEQIDDLESSKEELESEVESKDERIETLETNDRVTRELLATRLVEGSAADPELIVNSDEDTEVLAEKFAEANDIELDEDDDTSPVEAVMEQLAESPSLRGGGDPSKNGPGRGTLSEEDEERAEQLANSVMTMRDVQKASTEQLSPREYVKTHKGVDPADHSTEASLRAAMKNGDGGEN